MIFGLSLFMLLLFMLIAFGQAYESTNEIIKQTLKEHHTNAERIAKRVPLSAFEKTLNDPPIPTYANWMEKNYETIKDIPLSNLILPGSHESSAYDLSYNLAPDADPGIREIAKKFNLTAGLVIHGWAQNSKHNNLYAQMMGGIRFFDIRVCYDGSEFRSAHSIFGHKIAEMMEQVGQFIAEHPKELIILTLSHFNGFNNQSLSIHQLHEILQNEIIMKYIPQEKFIRKDPSNSPLMKSTLDNFITKGQQVLLLYEGQQYITFPKLIWDMDSNMRSPYANENTPKPVYDFIVEALQTYYPDESKIHVYQVVMTETIEDIIQGIVGTAVPGYTVNNIISYVVSINQMLSDNINKIYRQLRVRPTVFLIDAFEETSIIERVIELNNVGCQDAVGCKANCKLYADHCNDPSSVYYPYLSKNCTFTCGKCQENVKLLGDTCSSDEECHSKVCTYHQCAIGKQHDALQVGDPCGKDFQCDTGKCNIYTRRCVKRLINEVCTKSDHCQSGQCIDGICSGDTKFTWWGTAPLCKTYQKGDCERDNSQAYVTDGTCGDGASCTPFIGKEKLLCSNTLLHYDSYVWGSCGSVPDDCATKYKGVYLTSNPCGNGSRCSNGQQKILCGV